MDTETGYSITKNDLKYKKMRNLDVKKINTFDKNNKNEYNKELEDLYYNNNFDTLEYRIQECKKEGNKILDLKYLDFKKFPNLNKDLIENLEELYISNNEIDELPDLDQYKKLKILDVSVNKLKKIGNLPSKIIEFCCFENKLEDINQIKNCHELKTLYISNNAIKDISCIENHPTLEILLANFNKIKDIPRNIPNLKKIQIKNNRLKKIKSYSKLIYLDCRNNNITEIEDQVSLKDLIISYNEISDIPIINTLKYLEIVHTNIEKIKFMKRLEELICLSTKVKFISSKYKLKKSHNHNSKYLNLFFIPQE